MNHPSVPTMYDLGFLLIESKIKYGAKYVTEDTGIIWELMPKQGWVPVSRKKKDSEAGSQTFDGYKDFNNTPTTKKVYVPGKYADNPLEEDHQEFDAYKDFNNRPKTRNTYVPGKYADNTMVETASTLEIDRLHSILNAGGMTDEMIKGAMEISKSGFQKLGRQLHITALEAKSLYYSLITKLRSDSELNETYQKLFDDEDRYSFENDYNGNITIYDSESGKNKYLQGGAAFDLQDALDKAKDDTAQEQAILASYMNDRPLNEDTSYEDEIDGGTGTYNYPWKFNGQNGTATVEYSGSPSSPKINLVSVRDAEGDEIDAPEDMKKALHTQAVEFIGKA